MTYLHVRSLEKYHPGYKDRTLQWAKIHFKMVQGDPDCDMITNEIDWGRLVKIILLELEAQQPLPNNDVFWKRKGFDLKTRPMSLTIKMLHNFLESVENVPRRVRVREDKEEDKSKIKIPPSTDDVKVYFQTLNNPNEHSAFYDHFQSNGWRVGGKTPMKDWMAAARNWDRNCAKFNPNGKKIVQVITNPEMPRRQTKVPVEQWAKDAAPPPKDFTDLVKKLSHEKDVSKTNVKS